MAVSLPREPIPRDEVKIGNEAVLVRGLSRSEVVQLARMEPDAAEDFLVACGCGISLEEAKTWRDEVPPDFPTPLLERIAELSGLSDGAQKSS